MLVLSHRGYHERAAENTLAAFAQAVDLGVDGIETDLRLAADGQIVLFHDRHARDGRAVRELTRTELCAAMGFDVPTLDDALDGFPGILWNLEIKVPEALDAALAAVRQRAPSGDLAGRFMLSSFWHNVVVDGSQRLAAPWGLLTADRQVGLPAPFAELPVLTSPAQRGGSGAAGAALSVGLRTIVWYYETLDPTLLGQAGERGVHNWAYGAKTRAELQRCRDLGCQAVIADRPEWALV
ncbi:MAG: glycerophosphodiester phosphodiesterase [Pirellulales bacterium]|nr:glycerophosphodiester phosphodiesterase [Pirellulales bacterium]